MGHAYDENRVLSAALEYQRRTGWHRMHPEAFKA